MDISPALVERASMKSYSSQLSRGKPSSREGKFWIKPNLWSNEGGPGGRSSKVEARRQAEDKKEERWW